MFGKHENKSFTAVAVVMILIGAAIVAFGAVAWLINTMQNATLIAFPSLKIMGGLVIVSLGYIQLELSLLRRK